MEIYFINNPHRGHAENSMTDYLQSSSLKYTSAKIEIIADIYMLTGCLISGSIHIGKYSDNCQYVYKRGGEGRVS